ncbi:MAG: hypothetical protein IJS19_07310 [Muribaculaceae bacterium]|nr:hypothetical protein [Muribaculaceae bacterium]
MDHLPEPLGVLEGDDAAEWVERHKGTLLKRCGELAETNVLDPDEVRNILQLIGYNGKNVPVYKKACDILMGEEFKRRVSEAVASGNPTITFMSGIGGAGKSTVVRKSGIDTKSRGEVYDSAFNDKDKLFRKMKEARDAGMTDIEVIVVYNDGLTAFKNTVARGKAIGRFLGINNFLSSYERRNRLLSFIDKHSNKLGVNVTIIPLDNTGNASRGRISVEQALSEWDYDPKHYIKDILEFLDDEIQQGRLTENQIASIAGDISGLKEEWKLQPDVQRLAERIGARVREGGERDFPREVPGHQRLGLADDASPTGSFSITAEDAGRSRKSAVEAMGGEGRWGEWLDAAAA